MLAPSFQLDGFKKCLFRAFIKDTFCSLGKRQFCRQICNKGCLLKNVSRLDNYLAQAFGKLGMKSRTLSIYFQNTPLRLHSNDVFILAR